LIDISSRKEKALEILESILNDIEDSNVTTTALLYRCQKASKLLDLDESETLWINLELVGYPKIPIEEEMKLNKKFRVPAYRHVILPAKSPRPPFADPRYPHTMLQLQLSAAPLPTPFLITYPCMELETANQPKKLVFSKVVENESDSSSYFREKQDMVVSLEAILPVEKMRGMSYSIRAKVHDFATWHFVALQFGNAFASIFDETQNLIAIKLGNLNPVLIELLKETVSKQERGKDPLEWKQVLDNVRTIIRRFTGEVLRSTMLSDSEAMPGESAVKTKLDKILKWIKQRSQEKFGRKYEVERKAIRKTLDFLDSHTTTLLKLVNKPIHEPDIKYATKGMVDRVVIALVVWMGNMIELLDMVDYSWKLE